MVLKFNNINEALKLCSDIPIEEIGAIDFKYYRNFSSREWGYCQNEDLKSHWPGRKSFEELNSIFKYAARTDIQNKVKNILDTELDIFKSLREAFFPKHKEFYKMKNVNGPSKIPGVSIEQLYSSGFVSLLMTAGNKGENTLFYIDDKDVEMQERSFIEVKFKSKEQAISEDRQNMDEIINAVDSLQCL